MNNGNTSEQTGYQTVKTYLKPALEQMIAAGRDLREFGEFAAKKFGDTVGPHVLRFLDDVRDGRISIRGLPDSAKAMLLGHRVSPQQREEMIRNAAYFKAAQRGFAAGLAEEDWYAAEKEIDREIEQGLGLLHKGYRGLSSAAAVAEKEFDHLKRVVTEWAESRPVDKPKPM